MLVQPDFSVKFVPVRRASLVLAALLQMLPICRPIMLQAAPLASAWALFFRWVAGSTVTLGGYHAISAASAAVSGLTKYSNSVPLGLPTNFVVEPVGRPFRYRITVSNPGSDVNKNYYNCTPLPPGLSINTAVGAAGYITGTPTNPGTYIVTLVAGNLNYPVSVTAPATLVLFQTNARPLLVQQPGGASALAGGTATFTVSAQGTPPLRHQWLFAGTNLFRATNATLTLTNVSSAMAGDYRVVVTNGFGSVTSNPARLTINEPFSTRLQFGPPRLSNGLSSFRLIGPIRTNYVIWRSTALGAWLPLRTNYVLDGIWDFMDGDSGVLPQRFYRATTSP